MKNFDYPSDWSFRLGEVEIYDQDIKYYLVVGYTDGVYGVITDKSVYVRLYGANDILLVGTWLHNLSVGWNNRNFVLSSTLYQEIKKHTERLEALKVFA